MFLHPNEPRRALQRKAPEYSSLRPSTELTQPLVSACEGAELGRVVVLRDSFFEGLRASFAEHFTKAVYLWIDVGFPAKVIEQERPSLVVLEMVERQVSHIQKETMALLPMLGRTESVSAVSP